MGALYGPDGIALAAVGIAAVIPLVNALAVWFLTRMIGEKPATLRLVLVSMARNPIIIACLIGIGLNAAGIGLHPLLANGLDLLGRGARRWGCCRSAPGCASPRCGQAGAPLLLSNVLKLVAVPALTLALAPLIGLGGVALQVAVLFNALPSSASSYVFARALGGDHELMAAILTT